MSKNKNPLPLTVLLMFLMFAVFLILLLSALSGCNPERKIQRAEQIVRTEPNSFDKIGAEWSLLHPCANDTLVRLMNDTTTHHDTTLIALIDSLVPDTIRINTVQTITKLKIQTIIDHKAEQIWKDSAAKLRIILASSEGQIIEKDKRVKDGESKNTSLIWLLIGAVSLGFISNGAWITAKFKGII